MDTTTDNKQLILPAVRGKYAVPGQNPEIDPGNSVHPPDPNTVNSLDILYHVHPRGGGDRTFVQPPSAVDIRNAVAPTNIVVGAANKRVYFYDSSGVIRQMSLKQFMKEP